MPGGRRLRPARVYGQTFIYRQRNCHMQPKTLLTVTLPIGGRGQGVAQK